ncbi:hypothetical protein DRJ25_00690 [Candidatus Woesearchaeota archaeon]|nr:MAG: hypothetical protein DRJ25_00690 [Candidatus Woesearchaeota archaeon]
MNEWKFVRKGRMPKLKKTVLIEGLPGIGNIGKIAVDFIIDELKAKKIGEFRSNNMPNSVFINDLDEVELPTIELYHIPTKEKDLLFLSGDLQPLTEESCHAFCETVLDAFDEDEIITIGGIAKKEEPKTPKVFCTGTEKKYIEQFKKGLNISNNAHKNIGPVIGVTGLLIGLAKRRKKKGIMLLSETDAYPLHLGVKGAKKILNILKQKFKLNIKPSRLNKEVKALQNELNRITTELTEAGAKEKKEETKYIG